MNYYSEELNTGRNTNSAYFRKSNKWFEDNLNKIQGTFPLELDVQNLKALSTSKVQEHSETSGDDQPCALNYYVLPQLNLWYWICLLPNRIKYDKVQKTFVSIQASLFRKVFIILIQILTMFYTWGTFKKIQASTGGVETLGFLYTIMYTDFALLAITFYYTVHTKGDNFRDLLNSVEIISADLKKAAGCSVPSRRKVVLKSIFLVAVYVYDACLYTTIADISFARWDRIIVPTSLLEDSTRDAFNAFHSTIGNPTLANYTMVGTDLPFHYTLWIGVPYLILATYSTFTWASSFQTVLLWGLLFRRLILAFFDGMARHQNENCLEFLRKFHRLTQLIEDFNGTFGLCVFTCIFACVMYMSNTIWTITDPGAADAFAKIITASAFFMCATNLVVCSEVNNMANRISFALKRRYESSKVWNEAHAGCMEEVSQGQNMVYYDLISNSVGVKGYGFFTITYGFVGTVVSMIATYSIIILQFKTGATGASGS